MRIGQNPNGDISGCSEGLLYYAFSSRALRSLPLSVMMSGSYGWNSGNSDWGVRNGYGYFWSSTLGSYPGSRLLSFFSTNVYPMGGSNKPNGFTLRCVAQTKRGYSARAKIASEPETRAEYPPLPSSPSSFSLLSIPLTYFCIL
ncbi:hypothetical protein IKF63_00295 [Candidatus Saccharibacteria bacterium]|nr:hypothetical protein [Candidatus Saccharibacteria bacterium]